VDIFPNALPLNGVDDHALEFLEGIANAIYEITAHCGFALEQKNFCTLARVPT